MKSERESYEGKGLEDALARARRVASDEITIPDATSPSPPANAAGKINGLAGEDLWRLPRSSVSEKNELVERQGWPINPGGREEARSESID